MEDSNCTESNQSIQQELQNPPAAGPLLATDAGATPVKNKRKGWAQQNCYYLIQALLFFGAVIANVVSLIFFVTDAVEYNCGNWTKCFLFVDDGNCNGKAASCYFVVGAELIAALLTFAMSVMYIVWMVKGAKIMSRFRVIDLVVVFALALLSCAVGIVVTIGIDPLIIICDPSNKKCSSDCIRSANTKNSYSYIVYASFALAAFYLLIFVLGMIPIVVHFICCNKVRRATNDEATPILSASRRRTLT